MRLPFVFREAVWLRPMLTQKITKMTDLKHHDHDDDHAHVDILRVTSSFECTYEYHEKIKGYLTLNYRAVEQDATHWAVDVTIRPESGIYYPIPISLFNLGLQSIYATVVIDNVTYPVNDPAEDDKVKFGRLEKGQHWSDLKPLDPFKVLPAPQGDHQEDHVQFLYSPTYTRFTFYAKVHNPRVKRPWLEWGDELTTPMPKSGHINVPPIVPPGSSGD